MRNTPGELRASKIVRTKQAMKRIVPAPLFRQLRNMRNRAEQRREALLDSQRYVQYSAPDDGGVTADLTGRHLEAHMTKDYHGVEKGMSLRDPRRPFGNSVMERLDLLIPAAESQGVAGGFLEHAHSARTALLDWNESGVIDDALSPVRPEVSRGIESPEQFFTSRRSVRDYADRPVAPEVLAEAVRLAINTPSVCNRQAWQVRFYTEAADKSAVRDFQNGNSGLGGVPVMALVTVDSRLFAGVGERNQPWIEGGLFSMSLMLALHGLGVDGCMLNMCQPNSVMDALRRKMGIPEHELVIMLMAVGYGREGHRVARSPRRATDEVLLA
ncbi:nitroreductase family protein [Pseudarthrobacter sp. SSS035]|uniref:nitroreductase family protein n=1 Tax=Pseudarthrobacter sp. SSS035 TaxID=2931399 RepID=UPI00200D637C|nr:nitroreductase family protein [Pseudarthrobacter sp. SSS035]